VSATEKTGAPLAGKRVLIVEDETLVAMLLEDMIAELGGSVVGPASRLDRALQIARDPSVAIDVALLDVNLAGEDAFPVAAALAERGVPFAFSTGYGGDRLPQRWSGRPALNKPFMPEQVAGALVRALQEG
jgi:CheY-like chemotaxis protein